MAEIRGLSIKQMDKRADRFVATIEQELRSIARKTAAGLGEVTVADASPAAASVADLNKIKALWEAIVDGQLLSILAAALFSSSGATADSINRVVGRPISTPIGEDTVVELAMKQARNQLVNIGDDYWSEARDSLTEGLQEGESIPKLSARVQDAVEVTRPRAEVIARTEIMRASNQGSIMTMRASELVTMKSWLATPDARTRPSHRAADGQAVPLDDPFVIGGEVDEEGNVVAEGVNLDHPGDPLGPPNETIQCRCTMLYEVADVELDDEDEDLSTSATPFHDKHPEPLSFDDLVDLYRDRLEDVTSEQGQTFSDYGLEDYSDINRSMRNNSINADRQKQIDTMQEVFDMAGTTGNYTDAWRGIKHTEMTFGGVPKTGDTFRDKAFGSVSTDENQARKFVPEGWGELPSLLKITIPPGANLVPMQAVKDPNRGWAGNAFEKELLLNSDTEYRVTSVEAPSGDEPRVIHLEVVIDG